MAAINSSVLACNYATVSSSAASDLNSKLLSMPSKIASPIAGTRNMPVIRAQSMNDNNGTQGRRAALLFLGSALFATVASNSPIANAGIIDEYLEKSKANKELNDQKRLATSGANFSRAYTVQFGSCTFPFNFTGCQDLAKLKKVPFISDDLEIECKGKEKYKCGSNVFWKW